MGSGGGVGGGAVVERDWRERGKARGCEIVCICVGVGVRVCACVDAVEEICN